MRQVHCIGVSNTSGVALGSEQNKLQSSLNLHSIFNPGNFSVYVKPIYVLCSEKYRGFSLTSSAKHLKVAQDTG